MSFELKSKVKENNTSLRGTPHQVRGKLHDAVIWQIQKHEYWLLVIQLQLISCPVPPHDASLCHVGKYNYALK